MNYLSFGSEGAFTKTISDKFYEIDAEGNIVTKEELTTKDVYEEISKLPTKVIYINTDDILENSKPLLPVLYLEGDTYQNIAEVLYPYWYRTIPTPALHMISYNVVADVTLAYPSGTRLLGTQSDHWFIALGDEATQTLRFLNNKPIANEILLGIKEVVSGTYTFEEAKQQVANSITAFLEMPYYDGHPVELGKLYQFENTTDTYDVVIYKDGSMAIFAPFLGNRGSYVTADKVKWSDSRIYITNNVGEIYYMDVLSNGNFEDNVTDVRGEFVKSESATLANELPEGTYVCESADVIIKFRSDDIELYEVNTHIGTISNDYVSIKDGLITINIEGELITLALHPNGKYIIVDDLFFKYQVLEN